MGYASRFLESYSKWCSKLTCVHFWNHLFLDRVSKILLLTGLLSEMQSECAIQISDPPIDILKNSACTSSAPIDEPMSKLEGAEIHVFFDSLLCPEKNSNACKQYTWHNGTFPERNAFPHDRALKHAVFKFLISVAQASLKPDSINTCSVFCLCKKESSDHSHSDSYHISCAP